MCPDGSDRAPVHEPQCALVVSARAFRQSVTIVLGPEPNALSGELQARERFSLDCGVRGSISSLRSPRCFCGRVPEQRTAGADSNPKSIASYPGRGGGPSAG